MPKNNEEEEKKIKRKAVIIGINDYRDDKIDNLEGAVNDAKGMKKVLEKYGTFDIEKKHFLTNKNANCAAIRKVIWDLFINTDIYELALFYFSGHGLRDGYGNGYIAPHDMIKNEPFVKGIDMRELTKIVLKSPHKNVLMIFDCCYSGIAVTGEALRGSEVDDPFKEFFLEKLGKGKFIMASSEEDEKSEEKTELKLEHEDKAYTHGIYTFHLLEGLYGYGKADETGNITIRSLAEHIKDKMKDKEQKSDLWFDEAGTLGDFVIGVVPEIRNEFIKKHLDEANKYLRRDRERPDIMNSIPICKCIQQVLEIVPNNLKALKIKNYIDNKLKDYSSKAIRWLSLKEREIKNKLNLDYLWDKLEQEWEYFDYDRILEIENNEEEVALLACLWKVSIEVLDMPKFIKTIKGLIQPQ